jgi:hypothetical protein
MSGLPPVYALRRIEDDRWELIGPDDDPRRLPWRRWAVVTRQAPLNLARRTAARASRERAGGRPCR